MTSLLYLSDGTTTVDFLAQGAGLHLADWKPALPAWKGGGVWAGSPLSDGRRLAVRNFENAVDAFDLKASGASQDAVIEDVQNLRALLEAAVAYWSGVGENPVYLATRGPCESEIRYAVVIGWKTDAESNPFAQPFFSLAPLDEFPLAIEHGPWLETVPGTSTAVQLSAQQAYNGLTYGRAATVQAEVFVGNASNLANITHAYYYDASTVSFSANLIGAAKPVAFLPAVPAVGDYIVFGVNAALANSGPFGQVVFDITTPATFLTGVSFTVSTGAGPAWTVVTVQDNTGVFLTSGTNAITIRAPSTWVSAVLNGVDAFWFKVEVTGIVGAPTAPSQGNRDFYATPWASVDLDGGQAGGDIPALARHIFDEQGPLAVMRIMLGLRGVSRGADFRMWLNASDEQNPTGISVALGAGAAFAATGAAPSGRAVTWNPGAPGSTSAYWEFGSSIAANFFGRFRLFGRFSMASALTDVYAYAQITDLGPNVHQATPNVYLEPNSDYFLADFGQVDLPGTYTKPNQNVEFRIYVQLVTGSATPQLTLFDIALLPVDEAAWDFLDMLLSSTLFLDADSISSPRYSVLPDQMYVAAPTTKFNSARWVAPGPLVWQAGSDQRLWILQMTHTSDYYYANPASTGRIHSYRQQRYLSMRGAR